jgi:hypothetical protein
VQDPTLVRLKNWGLGLLADVKWPICCPSSQMLAQAQGRTLILQYAGVPASRIRHEEVDAHRLERKH